MLCLKKTTTYKLKHLTKKMLTTEVKGNIMLTILQEEAILLPFYFLYLQKKKSDSVIISEK